jgi:hypothetical protein
MQSSHEGALVATEDTEDTEDTESTALAFAID